MMQERIYSVEMAEMRQRLDIALKNVKKNVRKYDRMTINQMREYRHKRFPNLSFTDTCLNESYIAEKKGQLL
jgi:hypothetical protein